MDMVGPLIEEATLLYFVGIDCVTGKGEYGRSSLAVWTVEANKVFGNEFVYACCKEKLQSEEREKIELALKFWLLIISRKKKV